MFDTLTIWNFNFFYIFLFGFYLGEDHFIHFEQSQLLGGVKTGDPRENPPEHQQAELGLSHMWYPQRWNDERFRVLKISVLNHTAMGATLKFLDRQLWANRAYPDQTAPRGACLQFPLLDALL